MGYESVRGLVAVIMQGMVIYMNEQQLQTLEQLQAFLDGTTAIQWQLAPTERYACISRTLRRFAYGQLKRAQKRVVLRYLERISGYSRQQLTRLVKRGLQPSPLRKRYRASRCSFSARYTAADVQSLADIDALHGTLSGPATKKLMERAWALYGEGRYERLGGISVAHLYNLRHRLGYTRHRQLWSKTRPLSVPIGTRRAPAPNDKPGFLRVDSVHQGDRDGLKGIYHINAVDCVTQFEAVGTCERLSEAFLIPVLEELLHSFPFIIRGFHSGSEYINKRVAALLHKMLIEEQTKSRSRQTNDNAQAESKNGSIVRKHFGYSHVPQRFARLVNEFCGEHLNPYINFHRPCLYAETLIEATGRQHKRYPYELMMTPYEKFKSMPQAAKYLKPGHSFEQLDAFAGSISDNDAARQLNEARSKLFKAFSRRSISAA